MVNDADKLQEKLTELHEQLRTSQELPPKTRAMLVEIVADIERVLSGEKKIGGSIAHRLNAVVSDFEGQHPTLSGTVGSIIDALSRMGI